MILFYFGKDFLKKQKKIEAVLKNVKSKRPNANFFHYDSYDIDIENLKELLKSQGLFETKNIVLLSNLFIDDKLKKWIIENIQEFKNSESAFIFSEEKLTAKEKKEIQENAEKFEEFPLGEKKSENLFVISNYIHSKNKKQLWTFYQEKMQSGLLADEIYPIIFWSLKTLNLAEKFSEKESGLKSFPYKKAKSALKNWRENEPSKKIFQLLKIHSESRRGKLNLKNALEKFILEL